MTSAPATQTNPPEGTPRMSWMQLGVVSLRSFVVWAGFGAIIPYLPIFLKQQAHSSMTLWAVIASMFYVGHAPLLFATGLAQRHDRAQAGHDRWGRRVHRRPPAVHDHDRSVLVHLLPPAGGHGAAAFGPAAQAFVADITTTEHTRSRAYGFLTTAQFGGLIFGPALAAPLYTLPAATRPASTRSSTLGPPSPSSRSWRSSSSSRSRPR